MTAVRRSARERRPAETVYDEARRKEEEASAAAAAATPRRGRSASSTTTPSSSARRSGRRSTSASAEKKTRSSSRKRKKDEEEEETEEESVHEEDEEEEEEEEEEESSSSSSEDEDDDFKPNQSSARKKTPTPKKKRAKSPAAAASKAKKPKKIQVQLKPARGGRRGQTGRTKRGGGTAGAASTRSLHNALAALGRKVLTADETPSTSLVAGLLQSYRPLPEDHPLAARVQRQQQLRKGAAYATSSVYAPQLTALSTKLVELHNDDPNAAQIKLLNLLFRSVGGSIETNLDPDEHKLDRLDDDEWASIVTDLVDEMRHSPVDRVLLCSDPEGAAHAAEKDKKTTSSSTTNGSSATTHVSPARLAIQEYRRIYDEFWYVLGGVALSEGAMSTARTAAASSSSAASRADGSDDDGSSVEEEGGGNATGAIRYDAELVRDLLHRVVELSSVGQPDVRSASTVAAMALGRAVLDRSVDLCRSIDVAQRQFDAMTNKKKRSSKGGGGKKSGGGGDAKSDSIRHRIDSLKRTRADLEEIVSTTLVQGVFVHRYRDSDPHIRAACLDALSAMVVQRPDLYLHDKYLKYFGWMMSDKSDVVRCTAVRGLLAPFDAVQAAEKAASSSSSSRGRRSAAGGTSSVVSAMADKIDLTLMEHVVAKFLTRLADCVIDVSPKVQEVSMRFLLALLRDGFLDDVESDEMWDQINLRALAKDAPPAVRRDALYFIMEQLEAFDEGDDEDEPPQQRRKSSKHAKNASSSAVESAERRTAVRLDAIASWAAHALTNGPVPLEKIQIDLADFLVQSLRDMPEHRSLVTDWSAMLRAIGDDNAAYNAHVESAGERVDVAKQRVLVRMLACAARAEVGSVADPSFLNREVDPDVATESSSSGGSGTSSDVLSSSKGSKKGGGGNRASSSTGHQHESLSVALLKALPDLLVKFKSDSAILGSLTSLPRFLIPTVFSLPQRKNDFTSLTKNLSEIFLQSTDEVVLTSTALSLTCLAHGDHTRAPDAKVQLQNVMQELKDRVVDLCSEKPSPRDAETNPKEQNKGTKRRRGRSSSSRGSSQESLSDSEDENDSKHGTSKEADVEYAVYLNLKRLRVLAKRCDLSEVMGASDEANQDDASELEALCTIIAEGLAHRLKMRKPTAGTDAETEEQEQKASVWAGGDKKVPGIVANAIDEGLQLLLCVTAWKFSSLQENEGLIVKEDDDVMDTSPEEHDDDDKIQDHVILRLRNVLVGLLELCFEQYLPDRVEDDDEEEETERSRSMQQYTSEQISFSNSVQESAGKIASDLRCLFPKELADAASPLLRSFAIQDDGRLIGGFVRYFRSQEEKLRSNEDLEDEDRGAVHSLVLPLARSLAFNWSNGNRREAGICLQHISSSGATSSSLVSSLSRVMKKVEPVRLLEAHMASLRQSYEEWMDSEPEEMESDRPTDDEMAAFEAAETRHKEEFEALEHQASRFSMSLGVGKLSDPKLEPALIGFIREGIRFSFSNSDDDGEDELVLGSRLSFLSILGKYSNWVRRKKNQRQILKEDLDEKEASLREHPDYDEVHEDDLDALAKFRTSLGLKPARVSNMSAAGTASPEGDEEQLSHVHEDDDDAEESMDAVGELNVTPSPATARSVRSSRSVSSVRSRSSAQSSLSPLYEEEDEGPVDEAPVGEEDSPSPSASSRFSAGKRSRTQTQTTIDGEISDGSSSDDDDETVDSNLFKGMKSQTSVSSRASKKARAD